MTFAFVRVDRANRVTGRVIATDAQAARVLLPCGEGSYVTSEASHAVPVSRAVAAAYRHRAGQRVPGIVTLRTVKPDIPSVAPAVLAESRAELERQVAMSLKGGRPRVLMRKAAGTEDLPVSRAASQRGGVNRSLEAKRRHERKPERRAAKTAWQRAKRASR